MDFKQELAGFFTVVAGICAPPGLALAFVPNLSDFEKGFVWGVLFTALLVATLWWWIVAIRKRDRVPKH